VQSSDRPDLPFATGAKECGEHWHIRQGTSFLGPSTSRITNTDIHNDSGNPAFTSEQPASASALIHHVLEPWKYALPLESNQSTRSNRSLPSKHATLTVLTQNIANSESHHLDTRVPTARLGTSSRPWLAFCLLWRPNLLCDFAPVDFLCADR
jgi:hypothetical protein